MALKNKTRIIVQLENNSSVVLFLRGEGIPGLNWDKGVKMNYVNGEWIYEIDASFVQGYFKVLIDDEIYEAGENHPLQSGTSIRVNPKFPAKRVF